MVTRSRCPHSLVLPLLLLAACSKNPATTSTAIAQFPSAEELAAIAAKPIVPVPSRAAGQAVGEWQLQGPLPDRVDSRAVEGDSASDMMVRELAGQLDNLVPRESMQCFAREFGRFMLAHSHHPTLPLQQFMLDRCGVSSDGVGWAMLSWNEGDSGAERDDLAKLARESAMGGNFGVWLGTEGTRHVALLAAGRERATVDPVAMVVTSGSVELTGEIGAHAWVMGYASRGQHDARTCRSLPTDPNRFHLICPVDSLDAGAVIDVVAAVPGRMLGESRARVWVSPDGSLPDRYVASVSEAGSTTPRSAAALLELINGLRADVQVAPLALAPAQSADFEQLHGHYRQARHLGEVHDQDAIALGLLAGRSLGQPVLDGMFGELQFDDARSPAELLEATMLHPSARAALLDPERTLLAMSVREGEAGAVTEAIYASWTPAVVGHRPHDEDWVFELIELTRTVKGLPPLRRMDAAAHQALANGSAALRDERVSPQKALEVALEQIAANSTSPVRGMLLFSQDIEELEAPQELLGTGPLQLAVHVELYQPPDSAWAQLVVMIAFIEA